MNEKKCSRIHGKFLLLKIILAIPCKCSEMLHEAFHPPIIPGR